ncbi:MAG: FHA domain-containing protein [Anaerolineaceae bacterium]|nr:FHA domain-containing protein [Anaerolineaceae bacterium]
MQKQGAELPVLIGQTGPLNGQRWLVERTIVVGRDASCDIMIADRQVSRYHARLTLTEEGVLLEDLGSKNGTFYNGVRLEEPTILADGDLVQVSLVQHFVFLSSDATMPLEYEILPGRSPTSNRLTLDILSRRVSVGGVEILPPLSVPQFRLLQALYHQAGKVVERQQLINIIWGESESFGVSEQAFDALVRRLRDRLKMIETKHAFIVTVRGHGLRLDNPSE